MCCTVAVSVTISQSVLYLPGAVFVALVVATGLGTGASRNATSVHHGAVRLDARLRPALIWGLMLSEDRSRLGAATPSDSASQGQTFAAWFLLATCLTRSSILNIEAVISSETERISTGLNGLISQKTVLFSTLEVL
jgi:hypothetical protein